MLALFILSGFFVTICALLTTKVSQDEVKEMLESETWFY